MALATPAVALSPMPVTSMPTSWADPDTLLRCTEPTRRQADHGRLRCSYGHRQGAKFNLRTRQDPKGGYEACWPVYETHKGSMLLRSQYTQGAFEPPTS